MKKASIEVFASEARTATPDPEVISTQGAAALYVIVEVTALAATPSVTFAFNLYDPVTETAVNLLTYAAVTTVSSNIYKISPALTAAANLVAAEHVPQNVQVVPTHGDADSITYQVSAQLL